MHAGLCVHCVYAIIHHWSSGIVQLVWIVRVRGSLSSRRGRKYRTFMTVIANNDNIVRLGAQHFHTTVLLRLGTVQ